MSGTSMVRIGALALLIGSLAACGGESDDGGNSGSAGGEGAPWILGTTDTVTALDPAGELATAQEATGRP
jgi:peptide/nickel transport system substrate-binding protein